MHFPDLTVSRGFILIAVLVAATLFLLLGGCSAVERKLLFFPTHHPADQQLAAWTKNGAIIGYARKAASPKNVWLMLGGNGGQASDRSYALPRFSADDSVFILEYPGYGNREGVPSRTTFNRAAQEAYLQLRQEYPHVPVCVASESIGSGPASFLASLDHPPDKVVMVVPFDQLSLVAKDHFPSFLVGLLLTNNWDNVEALSHYQGPVDLFGAEDDTIIPVRHAKALAAAIPSAKFVLIKGGHNDWSLQSLVKIRNP
jgi:uncharacterized protein